MTIETTPLEIPKVSRLREIADVLNKAIEHPYYTSGHPHAPVHLAQHVILALALEDIDARLKALEARK